MNKKSLLVGVLLLLGGLMFAYWAYFVQPDVFVYAVGMAGIAGILAPLIIIFLGIILICYGSSSNDH